MKRVSIEEIIAYLLERMGAVASIRDVAKLADVSPATVSRVMNGTAKVAPETRERVMRAIAQMEFVPNEVARSLFKKSAKTIGLVIPSIRNPYFTQLASIIDEMATSNGYRLFLCNVGDDPEKEKAALQMLSAMNADGVIIASSNDEVQEHIGGCPIPVVAVDTWFAGGFAEAYVYCDYRQGGRLAMEHLLDCGCRKIVCIQGPQRVFSARERYEGYRDVCRERDIEERTVSCDFDFDAGLAMTEELLEKYPDVDGIIACNDIVAVSTYKILHKKGIAVPEQIQLVGFDDIYLSSLISPELTTVAQPIEALAAKATELIIHHTENKTKGAKFVFPASLVIRETTKRKGNDT